VALKGMSGDYGGSLPAQGDGPIRTRRGDKLATLRLLERGYLRALMLASEKMAKDA